jgi:hypothetical protein
MRIENKGRVMKRQLQLGIAGLGIVLCLGSCVSYREKRIREFASAPLLGMVYDRDQKPCVSALITVDGQDGPRTDINGRFVIDELARGDHLIGVQKEGYEPLQAPVSFLDRTQVLYLRVISYSRLLREAEEALDRQKLGEAEELLDRAEALDAEEPVGLYLRAVLFLKRGDSGRAAAQLEQILARGEPVPAVLLTLADLCQYRLGDPARAASFLREYLAVEDSPDIRARLQALEAASQPSP